MKSKILIVLIAFLGGLLNAQTNEDQMKKTVLNYIQAGDENNATALETHLHSTFRVTLYDQKTDQISILDRKTYLNFIETKKFGGYPRTAEFHAVQSIDNHMATLQVTLTSPNKPTLKNFYSLVKEHGKWMVLQDYVVLIP